MTIVVVLLLALIILVLISIGASYQLRKDSKLDALKNNLITFSSDLSKIDPLIRREFSTNREEIQNSTKGSREELSNSFKNLSDTLQNSFKDTKDDLSKSLKSFEDRFTSNIKEFNEVQRQKFDDLAHKLEKIRETVEINLQKIQDQNSKKLDEIRGTVDEKLQSTLEKRFNESFNVISNRLDQVHQGLSESARNYPDMGRPFCRHSNTANPNGNLREFLVSSLLEPKSCRGRGHILTHLPT